MSVYMLNDYVCLFKTKTSYELRISDWSSDVCSSDLAQLLVVTADQAADQAVGLAALDHQRADQRGPRTQQVLGRVRGDPAALGQGVVLGPVLVEARIVVDVGELEVLARAQAQAQALDAGLDYLR